MSQLSNINYTNLSNSSYLSDCDLINKYNLNSLNKKPKLHKIILELSSRDILDSFEISGKNETDSEIQVKSFIILYILQSFLPFITFSTSTKSKDEGSTFLLKIILSNDDEIYSFLVSFFVENWNKLIVEDFSFFEKNEKSFNNAHLNQETFIIHRQIPTNVFFEIDNLLTKNSFGIISKNLNFRAKFMFQNENFKNRVISEKTIKNIPLFWING